VPGEGGRKKGVRKKGQHSGRRRDWGHDPLPGKTVLAPCHLRPRENFTAEEKTEKTGKKDQLGGTLKLQREGELGKRMCKGEVFNIFVMSERNDGEIARFVHPSEEEKGGRAEGKLCPFFTGNYSKKTEGDLLGLEHRWGKN